MIDILYNSAAVFGYAVLAVSGIVWWIFRTFSELWLNSKFAERLENLKHEQQKELAELKFVIHVQRDESILGKLRSFGGGVECLRKPAIFFQPSATWTAGR